MVIGAVPSLTIENALVPSVKEPLTTKLSVPERPARKT